MNPNADIPRGIWSNGARWSFYEGPVPTEDLVTAVFCLTLTPNGIVFIKTERGYWEMLGGHREHNESIESTLQREIREEGGVRLLKFQQFGYREVCNQIEVINKASGQPYPVIGYVSFFVGFGEIERDALLADDVVRREIVPINDLLHFDLSDMPDRRLFEIGLKHLVNLIGSASPEMQVLSDYSLRSLQLQEN